MKNILQVLLVIATLSLLPSCGSGNASPSDEGKKIDLKYARNLTMTETDDGVTVAHFRNPWDTTKTLQTIVMVDRDRPLPGNLPKGTVIRVPLEKSVVYTSVHNRLIEEMKAYDAVAGVCDSKYLKDGVIAHRVSSMTVADCGQAMSPNIEQILKLKPDAILLSAYENSNDHNKVGQLGIPVIDCIDYMESSPLGRAEWIKFFGRLYGKSEVADSMFNETEKNYMAIREKVRAINKRPIVLTEMIYGQSWDVPGANSTVGVMIRDAGAATPFAEYKQSGSVRLSPEEVLLKAKDADIWLIKYFQEKPMTLGQLAKENPMYTKFGAFTDGNVYGLDTGSTSYFEDAAFHPDWILAEYVRLFHPEIAIETPKHSYYSKLQK